MLFWQGEARDISIINRIDGYYQQQYAICLPNDDNEPMFRLRIFAVNQTFFRNVVFFFVGLRCTC